jgi:hypothetical protein
MNSCSSELQTHLINFLITILLFTFFSCFDIFFRIANFKLHFNLFYYFLYKLQINRRELKTLTAFADRKCLTTNRQESAQELFLFRLMHKHIDSSLSLFLYNIAYSHELHHSNE